MIYPNEVNAACADFYKRTGIEVTDSARNLIALLLSAVEKDPHPFWKADEEDLSSGAQQLLGELPLSLLRAARHTRAEGQLTTYQLMHWLSRNFDFLCPFEKD